MKRPTARASASASPSARLAPRGGAARHRGVATLWAIVAIPPLLVLLCLVVEAGNLWLARIELKNAMESAALAAVKQWGDAHGVGGTLVARQVGQEYARTNAVRNNETLIALNHDPANLPNENAACTGDLVFGAATILSSQVTFNAGAQPGCGDTTGPNLVAGLQTSGSGWTTVTLDGRTYASMVVIGTPNYTETTTPSVVRIDNVTASSFDFMVQSVNTGAMIAGVDVYFLVLEEGIYTSAADGVTMEAHKIAPNLTDRSGSWGGTTQTYSNTYTSPVVLGQVMSYADANWSVFWSRDDSDQQNPPDMIPSSGPVPQFHVGKHVAQDTNTTRNPETIGYLVIEAGSGTVGGLPYVAALGTDTVRGLGNAPPYPYTLTGLDSSSVAVVSQSAMDGGDGSWAVLYGTDPVTPTQLNLAVDEDQIGDGERSHTTEQLAYIAFAGRYAVRAQTQFQVTPLCQDLFGMVATPFTVSAEATAVYDCLSGEASLLCVDQYICPGP